MVARRSMWVGWDAEPDAVRAVALTAGPSGPQVQAVVVQELPQAGAEAGSANQASWLATILAELPARIVHATISGSQVAVKRLRLPPMAPDEVTEAARWQMKEQVGFSVEGARITVQPLGDVWEKDLKKQDVLVAMASPEAVEERRGAVEAAGARVASLMPRDLAIAHAVHALMPPARTGSVAICDLGRDRAHVVVLQEGRLQLSREIGVGESTVTGALVGMVAAATGEIMIDADQAKALVHRYGVLAEGAEGATETGVPLFHLASLMRPALERLVTELSRVLDFYRLHVDDAGASRVVLCGTGATLTGLAAFLSHQLGVPADVLDPLLMLPRAPGMRPPTVPGPALVAALGAALAHGEVGNVAQRGPAAVPWVAAWQRIARQAALASVACCGALLAAWLIVTVQLWHARSTFDVLAPAYREVKAQADSRAQAVAQVAEVEQFLVRQPAFVGLWKELGVLVPEQMVIDELRISAADAEQGAFTFRLEGHVTDAGAGLADLVDALDASAYVAQVKLARAELETGDAVSSHFVIEGMLE